MQTLAKHVMNIHMNALQMTEETRPGELHLSTLKKYIAYCRRYVSVYSFCDDF
jgi:DNA replication licensing factor MCM5